MQEEQELQKWVVDQWRFIKKMRLDLIGNINQETKTYHKLVDFRTQVFHAFSESIAISKEIINTRLKPVGVKYIKIYIKNYPSEPKDFIAVITLEDFLKHSWDTTGRFPKQKRGDSQYATPLRFFKRIDIHQEVIK